MHQETILLVGGDESARNEYLQRLQSAGYLVKEGLSNIADRDAAPPELVVATMPLSGSQKRGIKKLTGLERRPLMLFLLSEDRSQDATDALELGADDMLRRPVSAHDLRARLRLLAERRRRENLGRPDEGGEGKLSDISVSELIRQFNEGKGTATVQLQSGSHRGKLFFRDGEICGSVVDHYHGLNALIRAMRWRDGSFVIVPKLEEGSIPGAFSEDNPFAAAQEAAARWDALIDKLPPTGQAIQVDFPRVQQNLDELNDLAEQLLWQLASHRSLEGVIEDLDGDPVDALTQLCHLYEKGFFSTRDSVEVPSVFTDAPAPSLEGIETGIALRTQGGDFSNRLANAAKEAAAQLMAAARPMASFGDQAQPDRFPSLDDAPGSRGHSPSFEEAGFGKSAGGFGSSEAAESDPVLFPLESPPPSPSGEMMLGPGLDINIHAESGASDEDDLFELGDFKNLSNTDDELPLDAARIDTTAPSLVAPRMEDLDFEPPALVTLDPKERGEDESLPSGEFERAFKAADDVGKSDEGVQQMVHLETMDVLDKLLQTELSSIADQDGVAVGMDAPATSSTAVLGATSTPAIAEPAPPKKEKETKRRAGMGLTMAYGPGVEEEPPKPARPKPSPKESAPMGISIEAGLSTNGSKGGSALSLDDLPAQKGSFPSLSLSDEFFLKDEDLRPVKPNKVKTFLLYTIGGIAFMSLGFLGMGWLAQNNQVSKPPLGRSLARPVKPVKPVVPVTPKRVEPRPVVRKQPKPLMLPTEPGAADAGPASPAVPDAGPARPAPARPAPARPAPARPAPARPAPRRPQPVVRRPVVRRPVRVARVKPRRPVVRRPVRRPPARRAANNDARASRLLRRALSYKRREKFSSAERVLRSALRLKPKRIAPYYSALGQVLYEREKTGQALRYLSRAYKISPRQTGAGLVTLGSIYYERRKRKQAKSIYRQYLKYFPRGKHADDVRAMLKN